jgi:phage terminase small subunit
VRKTKRKPRCAVAANARAAGASPTTSPDTGSPPSSLSRKHARFVAEYLIDLNASAAYRRAGFAAKDSNVSGPRLLANAGIAAAVMAGQSAQLATAGVSKARLLQELGRIALSQAPAFFDPATKDAKHPCDLTADEGACLAGFEVLIKNAAAGDGVTDTIHKFKLWDKVRALELYMKHYGMLVDKIEIKDGLAEARVARLVAARKRAK